MDNCKFNSKLYWLKHSGRVLLLGMLLALTCNSLKILLQDLGKNVFANLPLNLKEITFWQTWELLTIFVIFKYFYKICSDSYDSNIFEKCNKENKDN